MIKDKYGQLIYDGDEIFDILMHEGSIGPFLTQDNDINVEKTNQISGTEALIRYEKLGLSVKEFDRKNQAIWEMPEYYRDLNIVSHVLSLCNNETELQRCGAELLKYTERNLLNLLRYLKYLVDVMELNNIIWGVGRGSSVSSYVLYKLKVHRIDSIYYQLDYKEFLR